MCAFSFDAVDFVVDSADARGQVSDSDYRDFGLTSKNCNYLMRWLSLDAHSIHSR